MFACAIWLRLHGRDVSVLNVDTSVTVDNKTELNKIRKQKGNLWVIGIDVSSACSTQSVGQTDCWWGRPCTWLLCFQVCWWPSTATSDRPCCPSWLPHDWLWGNAPSLPLVSGLCIFVCFLVLEHVQQVNNKTFLRKLSMKCSLCYISFFRHQIFHQWTELCQLRSRGGSHTLSAAGFLTPSLPWWLRHGFQKKKTGKRGGEVKWRNIWEQTGGLL